MPNIPQKSLPNDELSILDLFHLFKKNILFIVSISVIITLVSSIYFLFLEKPRYISSAKLSVGTYYMIKTGSSGTFTLEEHPIKTIEELENELLLKTDDLISFEEYGQKFFKISLIDKNIEISRSNLQSLIDDITNSSKLALDAKFSLEKTNLQSISNEIDLLQNQMNGLSAGEERVYDNIWDQYKQKYYVVNTITGEAGWLENTPDFLEWSKNNVTGAQGLNIIKRGQGDIQEGYINNLMPENLVLSITELRKSMYALEYKLNNTDSDTHTKLLTEISSEKINQKTPLKLILTFIFGLIFSIFLSVIKSYYSIEK